MALAPVARVRSARRCSCWNLARPGLRPDPYQFGNAWAEDDLGDCTSTGLTAMTSGPAGFALAWALLAVTVGLPFR